MSSASRWKHVWQHGGVRALKARPHPGPEPKLQPQQQRQLVVALKRGTQHWGYTPQGWTGPMVRDLIWRLFAVDYRPDYVGTLLHRLGWSPQKPEQRARERREARALAATKKRASNGKLAWYFSMKVASCCNHCGVACGPSAATRPCSTPGTGTLGSPR
jgi:transposase